MPPSRILLAPTHRTGAAAAIASALAEVVGKQDRQVRYHMLGAPLPAMVWDRWQGSSFLDPNLYDEGTLVELYESAVRGADVSLLVSDAGALDALGSGKHSPATVARVLDCPVVLVLDCRGWGAGLAAVVEGFRSRLGSVGLVGVLLTGVRDHAHREVLRDALGRVGIPVAGCVYEGDGPGWDSVAPGAWAVPLGSGVVEAVHRQVDLLGLENLASQGGFLAAGAGPKSAGARRDGDAPLVLVAGGAGFTPWSRDSIEMLRAAGARVSRLDLTEDRRLDDDAAGLVLAGHLWTDALPELAENYSLMRDVRVRVSEGMPVLALGGGMLYLLRKLRDERGRSFDLAGVLPTEGEVIGELEEPAYFCLKVERDCLLYAAGESLTGWVTTDVEIMEAPASRNYPFVVDGPGVPAPQFEGVAALNLLSSRTLMHLASVPQSARRFVTACARFREMAEEG